MLGRAVLGVAGAIALTASANAADMYRAPDGPGGYKDGPYVPVETWTGFYAGINGGYAWGNDSSLTNGVNTVTVVPTNPNPPIDPSFSPSGGFGGGQLGYNWQRDRLVVGVEADLDGSGITGTGTETATQNAGSGIATAKDSLDWFGTVRGRLGYAYDRALIYATGGLAFGGLQDKLSVSASYAGQSATKTVQDDLTATGYAIGGGLEYAVSPAWSLKAEYQYIDLGSEKLSGTQALTVGNTTVTATGQTNFDHAYNTVRLGLNYHLLPGYEPLK